MILKQASLASPAENRKQRNVFAQHSSTQIYPDLPRHLHASGTAAETFEKTHCACHTLFWRKTGGVACHKCCRFDIQCKLPGDFTISSKGRSTCHLRPSMFGPKVNNPVEQVVWRSCKISFELVKTRLLDSCRSYLGDQPPYHCESR